MSYIPKGWDLNRLILGSELARSGYKGETSPLGWQYVSVNTFIKDPKYLSDNGKNYISNDDWFNTANASVLKSGNTVAITFRGTDSLADIKDWIQAASDHSYIDLFAPLLKAVFGYYKNSVNYIFAGHSLGGAAVNQLASALTKYGDFSKAELYAIASPQLNKNAVLNFGFDNDLVYGGADWKSQINTNDHTIIVNSAEDVSYYNVPDFSGAHDRNNYVSALKAISKSKFIDEMNYDSYIFLINSLIKLDIDDRFNKVATDIFIIGSTLGDNIKGTGKSDHFDMGGGNDTVEGAGGSDIIYGGKGVDALYGGDGDDTIYGEDSSDNIFGGAGADITFGGIASDNFFFAENDIVKGEVIDGGSFFNELNRIIASGTQDFRLATMKSINEFEFVGDGNFIIRQSDINKQEISVESGILGSSGINKLQILIDKPKDVLDLRQFAFYGWSSSDVVNIAGSIEGDVVLGTSQNDVITGGGGADILRGYTGNDIFKFQDGDIADKEINGGLMTEINRLYGYGTVHFNGATIKAINKIQFSAAGQFYFDASQIAAANISYTTEVIGSKGLNSLNFLVGNDVTAGSINLSKLNISSWSSTDEIHLTGYGMVDRMIGSTRADIIKGGGGNDTITGGGGKDTLLGESGDDTFRFIAADIVSGEVVNGGAVSGETNTISTSGDINFGAVDISNINALKFENAGTLTFKAHQVSNQNLAVTTAVSGSSGLNQLLFYVSASADPYQFSKLSLAQFVVSGWERQDKISIYGSEGMDILQGAERATYVDGGAEDDIIYGGDADDILVGGAGSDVLYGGGGNDTFLFTTGDVGPWEEIRGGAGVNELAGKGDISFGGDNGNIESVQNIHFLGSGVFSFDSTNWIFQFEEVIGSSGVNKVIFDNGSYDLDVSSLTFTNWSSSDIIELRGNRGVIGTSYDDLIYGSGDLNGSAGNDVIRGSGILTGGKGHDQLYGGSGKDILVGDDAGDILVGGGGYDTFDLWVPGVKWSNSPGMGKVIFHYNTVIDRAVLANRFGDFQIGSGATSLSFDISGMRVAPNTGLSVAVFGNDKSNSVTYSSDNGNVLFYGYGGNDVISLLSGNSKGGLYFADFEAGKDKIKLSGVDSIQDYFELKTTEIGNGIYLQRSGTAREWSVVKHTVSSVGVVENDILLTVSSGADYMSNSDFII